MSKLNVGGHQEQMQGGKEPGDGHQALYLLEISFGPTITQMEVSLQTVYILRTVGILLDTISPAQTSMPQFVKENKYINTTSDLNLSFSCPDHACWSKISTFPLIRFDVRWAAQRDLQKKTVILTQPAGPNYQGKADKLYLYWKRRGDNDETFFNPQAALSQRPLFYWTTLRRHLQPPNPTKPQFLPIFWHKIFKSRIIV